MGVKGLQTYLCGDKQRNRAPSLPNGTTNINIPREIQQWKRAHPNKLAIIVVDAMGLIQLLARKEEELFCGGRHHMYFKMFAKIFADLKACGATLVFFSDLNVQRFKIDEWSRRRNDEYDASLMLYDQIAKGLTVKEILKTRDNPKTLMTAFSAVMTEAENYGAVYYSTQHECDAELAKYARDNDAVAVLANDTDFLIFEGDWRYWSASDINLNTLDTIELNRKVLCDFLSLSYQQLALWSTLIGNDHTGTYFRDLRDFHQTLGPVSNKFRNVARFIRDFDRLPFNFTDADIMRISVNIFRRNSCPETRQLIKDSIQSYCLDFTDGKITDPLLKECVKYSDVYVLLISPIHTLALTMYDFRRRDLGKTYTEVMAPLLQRKIGALWKQRNDTQLTFELLAKWSHEEGLHNKIVYPMYPPDNLNVPPLLTVLFQTDNDAHSVLNTTRWKLLWWILQAQPNQLDVVKGLPKEYRLIAATLLFMVQQQQITALEADTILIAEMKVINGQVNGFNVPDRLNTRFVHVAHIYGKIHQHVSSSFSVAGLRPLINRQFKFDGVMFQQLSSLFAKNTNEMNSYLPMINNYRLYAN